MTVQTLVLRYTAFAAFATIANLLTQRIVLGVNTSAIGFSAAVLAGTLVGLIIKYLLDKNWIFHDRDTGINAHGQKFALYVATGGRNHCNFLGFRNPVLACLEDGFHARGWCVTGSRYRVCHKVQPGPPVRVY